MCTCLSLVALGVSDQISQLNSASPLSISALFSGKIPRIKDSIQDEHTMVHDTNRTSQQSNLDASESCDVDDPLDCLETFYGKVS